MIEARAELLEPNIEELKPLLPKHYHELVSDANKRKMELDPDYELYFAMERAGKLSYVTLREDGKLIGYFIGIISNHIHYKSTCIYTMDICFILPEYRGFGNGEFLVHALEEELKTRGVKLVVLGSKLDKEAAYLFEKLEYGKIEVYYSKWID